VAIIVNQADEASYLLKIGPYAETDVDVLRFSYSERLSDLFRLTVELASEDPELKFDDIVGKPASFQVQAGEHSRVIHGVTCRFEQTGHTERHTFYEAEIVPKLWLLSQRAHMRIFHESTIDVCIQEVLTKAGLVENEDFEFDLTGTHPTRNYCVQYHETDLDFVLRLLEEEGVLYFFEHSDEKCLLKMTDNPKAHATIPGEAAVRYSAPSGMVEDDDQISEFVASQRVRTGKFRQVDYLYAKPTLDLKAEKAAESHAELAVFEYPGGYEDATVGGKLAEVRLEEQQTFRWQATGKSTCRRLTAGAQFELQEHPRADFNKSYLLTEVVHRGAHPQALGEGGGETLYSNEFRVIPADTRFRPPRLTPKPVARGAQSAVVVPMSEDGSDEIECDEQGRVRVRFHWDLDGKHTCPLRICQVSAGSGFGFVFIPRVGQEVIVDFLEGDPDRPVVVGSVYNGDNLQPYKLADEKTKSVLKTSSTPDGEGFNEIRFEDKKDSEQVFVHAQKDFDLDVENDQRIHVKNDRHLKVVNDAKTDIGNDGHTKVGRHRQTEIVSDDHLKVGGKQAIEITESKSLKVTGDMIEVFEANHSCEVTGDYYVKAQNVVIEASSALTIVCGGSSVVLDSSGVTIKGSQVIVDGSTVKIASGPGSSPGSGSAGSAVAPQAPAEPAEADTSQPGRVSSVPSVSAFATDGSSVGEIPFKPPSDEELAEEEEKERTWVEIELVAEDGSPIPGELFKITLPDGRVHTGTTGPDGKARVDGIDPGTCQVTFPNLDAEAWEKA